MTALRVPLGELTRQLGVRKPYELESTLGPLEVAGTALDETRPVRVDVEIEAISGGGVVVDGTVDAPWRGDCRRCLEPVEGVATVAVKEIFEARPTEGETYPLGADVLDLEPMVRDAVLLALPLAPVCAEDCSGPAPDRFPTGVVADPPDDAPGDPPRDPRWAALDALREDS